MKKKVLAITLCLALVPVPTPVRAMNNDAINSFIYLGAVLVLSTNKGRQWLGRCVGAEKYWCVPAAMALVAATIYFQKRKQVQGIVDATCAPGQNCRDVQEEMARQGLPQLLPPEVIRSSGGLDAIVNPEYGRQIDDMKNQLGEAGYSIDPNTGNIRMPNGKTINSKDLNNPAALAAAGLSSSEIEGIQKAMNELNKNAAAIAAKANNLDLSEDVGGGRVAGPGSGGGGSSGGFGSDPYGTTASRRDVASEGVAGLSRVTSTGDHIGVAGDNIFQMVTRRYHSGLTSGRFDPNLPPPRDP